MHYLSLDNSYSLIKGELSLASNFARFGYQDGANYRSDYIDTVTEVCIRDEDNSSFIRIYGYQKTGTSFAMVQWQLFRDLPRGYKCINM